MKIIESETKYITKQIDEITYDVVGSCRYEYQAQLTDYEEFEDWK